MWPEQCSDRLEIGDRVVRESLEQFHVCAECGPIANEQRDDTIWRLLERGDRHTAESTWLVLNHGGSAETTSNGFTERACHQVSRPTRWGRNKDGEMASVLRSRSS
jgi:hypothetical protein